MARTASGVFENPGSTDDLVRDLEDSGYPVDGSREQFIRQPDVYLWRRARLWLPRYNRQSGEKLRYPKRRQKHERWRRSGKRQCCGHSPDELRLDWWRQYGKNCSGFV